MNYCFGCMRNKAAGETVCPVCGYRHESATWPAFALRPGTLLHDGKYLIGKVLGQGGFGITYIGLDTALELKVAIKEYYPMNQVNRSSMTGDLLWHSASDGGSSGRESFLKEARRMAKVNAIPGIVQVKDIFYQKNTAYIVMNFIEGETLKEKLLRDGAMTPEECVRTLKPVMEALGKAHQSGLIHRDISPDNIMIDRTGKLWVLDMGAAKDLESGSSPTQSSQAVTKRGFSPPEQIIGSGRGKIGPWTDVYSMCATMYYCMTGILVPEATERLLNDRLSFPASIPDKMASTLRYGLALRVEERIQNMQQLMLEIYGDDPGPQEKLYLDAIKLSEEAKGTKAVSIKINLYRSAVSVLQKISDYADSFDKIKEFELEIQRLEKKKRNVKIAAITAVAVCLIGAFFGIRAWNNRQQTISYPNGTYVGHVKNNLKNGQGTMTYSSGDVYEGEWRDDLYNGFGKMIYSNGSIYEGEWEDNQYNGTGVYTYADSTAEAPHYYEGELVNGKSNGQGKRVSADGTVYEGEWKNGERNGYGKQVYVDGAVYEGEWKNGERDGYGKHTFANGYVYEGEWRNNKQNGSGVANINGDIFEGEFIGGKANGYGTVTCANGEVKEGIWENGEFSQKLTASKWYNMGTAYWNGTDGQQQSYAEALKCFEKAGEFGHADAMYWVSILYRGHPDGQAYEGVPQNAEKAKEWLEKAKAAGYDDAQAALDEMASANNE